MKILPFPVYFLNSEGSACVNNCAEMGQILNTMGEKCLPDCSAINYILNSQETKCIPNCTSEGIMYVRMYVD